MGRMGEAGCHIVSTALMEDVAVVHHVAGARSALARAKCAPDEAHRLRAMRDVFDEIDAAESRLVALIESAPSLRMRCRRRMVEVDGIIADAQAWAASLPIGRAEVIDFRAARELGPRRSARSKTKNAAHVNENLSAVADDAPAAC